MTKPTGRPRGRPRKHPGPEDAGGDRRSGSSGQNDHLFGDEEIANMDREIERLEAELREDAQAPLVWGEATADELAQKEQRRGVLPRLITAAKIKRLELRRAKLERETEALEAERAERHRVLEEAQVAEERAKERRLEAFNAWTFAHGAVITKQDHARRLKRELRELQGDDAPAPVQTKPEPPAPTRYAPLTDPRQVEAMRGFYVMTTDAGGDDGR
jgi:hypothetical protein